MIITLTKADFSSCKIGTLTTFNVRKSTVIGASVNIIKTSVERAGYSSATTIATIDLDEANYEGHAIKVMMGSTDVSSWYSVGNVIVPAKTPITSNITISVSATAVGGGDPIVPDVPVTPTKYTFTINPTPANATVTLTASGYRQSGNSIKVPANTVVTWKVSANGFTEQKGSETVTKDKTINVRLSEVGGNTGGNTGGGSVEDETGITWYIDNAAQANKSFKYTSSFPGAGLHVNPERLTNKPINVIKFCPCGEGIFAFCKLTPGTQPAVSDVYTIDIPAADVAASGTDATPKTYLLDNTITLEDGQILMFSCNGNQKSIVKTAGFWVNAGGQPDYAVGVFNPNDYTIKDENWGLPFSIGYKS